MARTKGISGVAIGMIGAGALLVYSAIKNSSPLAELRGILGGQRPEKLSTETRATKTSAFGTAPPTDFQGGTISGKLTSTSGVKAHVLSAMQFVSDHWGIETQGFADRNIAGTNVLSDHAKGLALDAMTDNLSIGTAIANYFIMQAQARRVKYIIWQKRIWYPDGQGWRSYTGQNPHTTHVHISFYDVGSPRAL